MKFAVKAKTFPFLKLLLRAGAEVCKDDKGKVVEKEKLRYFYRFTL